MSMYGWMGSDLVPEDVLQELELLIPGDPRPDLKCTKCKNTGRIVVLDETTLICRLCGKETKA